MSIYICIIHTHTYKCQGETILAFIKSFEIHVEWYTYALSRIQWSWRGGGEENTHRHVLFFLLYVVCCLCRYKCPTPCKWKLSLDNWMTAVSVIHLYSLASSLSSHDLVMSAISVECILDMLSHLKIWKRGRYSSCVKWPATCTSRFEWLSYLFVHCRKG